MSLSSLPLDILLPIFQHLDITDVFRVGMVNPLTFVVYSSLMTFPKNVTDMQRSLSGYTRPSRLGGLARQVASERSGP